MGLLREFRSSLENPSSPLSFPAEWLLDIFNGGRTDSGIRVSEMTALQVTTVFACVNLISTAMGMLELGVYERILAQDRRAGKRIAYEHSLYDLLENEPNEEMTSFTFRSTVQAHRTLWGNGYAEIQRDNSNGIVAFWPRNPARCRPQRSGKRFSINGEVVEPGEMFYVTTEGREIVDINPESPETNEGPERAIHRNDMLHIPGLSLDGRLGQDTIWMARQAVGLALAAEKFGAKFYGNGARPGIAITVPGKLKPEAVAQLKQSFQEATGGENAHRPIVLTEGQTLNPFSVKPNEGQFLELRDFQRSEICSVFNVHPYMIGMTEKANRSSAEQISIEFVRFTLGGHLSAWQQELKRKCFPKVGRSANKYFAMFNTQPLLMPDAESQRAFFASGKQWGYLSTNMILEMLGLNPIDDPDADALWMPVNMQQMGASAPTGEGTGLTSGDDGDPNADQSSNNPAASDQGTRSLVKVYYRLFSDAFSRVCQRKNPDSVFFQRAFEPIFLSIAEGIWQVSADAKEEFNSEDFSDVISERITEMSSRLKQWREANGDREKLCARELAESIRELTHECRRVADLREAERIIRSDSEEERREAPSVNINVEQPAPAQPIVNLSPGIHSQITVETKPGKVVKNGHVKRNGDGTMSFTIEEVTSGA